MCVLLSFYMILRQDGLERHRHIQAVRINTPVNQHSLEYTSSSQRTIKMSEAKISSFQTSFRDVGASINKYAGTQLITPGKLYICASLDDATDAENELLRNGIKVKTIIDTKRRQEQQSDTTWLTLGTTGKVVTSKFLGVTRCRVNLVSSVYVKNIMAQLSVWTKWYAASCLPISNAPTKDLLVKSSSASSQSTRTAPP
jgi:hypothetical protein